MSEVRVGELNQQTGRVLRRVQSGESLIVTDHGRPVAMLVPAPTSRFDRMVALGQIRLPSNNDWGLLDVEPVTRSEDLDDVLAELQADTI
ncbi:hypothetical protein GCM10007979_24800 [Nocardioides albus]|nr:hypothetical protein GCM10007979_24800 [Nocardioides albus]